MDTISVCIATYERAKTLATTLEALATQTRLPDEIVVSDASQSAEAENVVKTFAAGNATVTVKYVRTERRALPWQRWWAFQQTSGEIAFFIDDDVLLAPAAIAQLLDVYEGGNPSLVGVGLCIDVERHASGQQNHRRLRERWLQTLGYQMGSISPGGISLPLPCAHPDRNRIVPVQRFSGGAMSFRRSVLESIGPLENLYALYDARLGKAEDGVLSNYASKHGELLLITEPLAIHRHHHNAVITPYASEGYRRGLRETWGRAHIFRWMASDRRALRIAWIRFAILELIRGARDIVLHPFQPLRWMRLVGAIVGIVRTVFFWRQIPPSGYSSG